MSNLARYTAAELIAFERRMSDLWRPSNASLNPLRNVTGAHDPRLLEALLTTDPVARSLLKNEHVQKIIASAQLKAKKLPQSPFASPKAKYELMSAICWALAQFNAITQSGKAPQSITRSDWRKALHAATTLRDLERKGLHLSRALKLYPLVLPFDWLDRIIGRLQAEEKVARKAYDDDFSADRYATRGFAHLMLLVFNDAPPTMIQNFAGLIGYSPQAARKRLAGWMDEYRTDSLL